MRLAIGSILVGMLLLTLAQVSIAGEGHNEGHHPKDGGARITRLIPNQGQHLPSKAWENGAPHVLQNVQKDPRNEKADKAIESKK